MAKMIKFNLTLKGAIVSTLDELQDNFSADILPIYRSGRLLKWLQARELAEQVQAVRAINPSNEDHELLGTLCRALGMDDDPEALAFLLEQWRAVPASEKNTATPGTESEDEGHDSPPAAPVDWSGKDMSGRNFEEADLRNGIFEGTNFSKCNFRGADLRGANFKKANLSECILSESDCTGADFTETHLEAVFAKKTKFTKAKFIYSVFSDTESHCFHECDFSGAAIKTKINCDMIACNFSSADLSNIYIDGWLTGSTFNGADLSFSEFAAYSTKDTISTCGYLLKRNPEVFNTELKSGMKNLINFSGTKILGCKGISKALADKLTANYEKLKNKAAK